MFAFQRAIRVLLFMCAYYALAKLDLLGAVNRPIGTDLPEQ
jgi:hypothetical protein